MLCSSVMVCPGKPTLQGQHGGGMGGDSLELSPSSIKQKGCDWMGVAHCVGLSNVFVTLSQWKRELQKVEFSQYTSFLRGLCLQNAVGAVGAEETPNSNTWRIFNSQPNLVCVH